jgi:hypothetical protein
MLQAVSLRPRPILGQLSAPFTVVVTDPRGAPFKGAQVTLQGSAMPVSTDANGVASFPSAPSGQVTAQVSVMGFKLQGTGPSDQTLFITVPVCADGPLLTNTELLALVLGGAIAAAGFYWKKAPAILAGEILGGSAIFSCVYRASCRW